MCSGSRALMATGPPVASVPTLDALSCDEPRKGVVDRRPGTHWFRGCPKKPVALYVLFTIETSLPRDLPHSATCCVLHEGPLAGSDSMQRVVILPLVASLAFFIAFSSSRRTRLRTASRRARGTPQFSTRLRLPCISSTSSSTGSVRVGGRFWVETLWRIAHGQTQRAKTSVPRPRHPTRGR